MEFAGLILLPGAEPRGRSYADVQALHIQARRSSTRYAVRAAPFELHDNPRSSVNAARSRVGSASRVLHPYRREVTRGCSRVRDSFGVGVPLTQPDLKR